MKIRKGQTGPAIEKIKARRQQSYSDLAREMQNGRTIIYLDETLFVPYAITAKSWARKGDNQVFEKLGTKIQPLAAAVALTGADGIISYKLQKKSIKTNDLLELLDAIKAKLKNQNIVLFCDNLPAHHSLVFRDKVRTCGWKIIYNAPYSPEYHCIEEVFSIIKKRYRREMLTQGFGIDEKAHITTIRNSIEAVKAEAIGRIEKRHAILMAKEVARQE